MTLKTIVDATREESEERQRTHPLAMIQRETKKMRPARGFVRSLGRHPFSIIAEIKRKSPSMGPIFEAAIETALEIYHAHPVVAAISVLTQHSHFGGSMKDLERVRALTSCKPKPILRKDFIFSEYEVYFSRWIGADAILLMANVVTNPAEFAALHDLAVSIGLDVLCEVHDRDELEIIPKSAKVCGINARRFKAVNQHKPALVKVREKLAPIFGCSVPNRDTQTDLAAFALFGDLPASCLKVAESGISSDNIAAVLAEHPFNAALVGTSLMKSGKGQMRCHLDKIQASAAKVLAERTHLEMAGNMAFAN